MRNDQALQLLREIDLVECEMRRLETRLTRIRGQIWESCGGERSGYQKDGQRKVPAQEVAHDWSAPPASPEPTMTQDEIRKLHGPSCDCYCCDHDGYWQAVHRGSQ